MINDEIVGWYHQLIGHEQALGVGDGQGSLAAAIREALLRRDYLH